MRRTTRTLLLAAVLVLTLGVAAPAQAGKAHPVPIKGMMTGTHWVTFDPPPGTCDGASFNFVSVGTGNVSHLGRVDYVLDNCTTLDMTTMTVSIEGTLTFTAANRDVLVIAHEGSGPFDPTTSPTSVTSYYDWTVDGELSTGRFVGASGSGTSTFVSTVQADPEISDGWLSGTIQYNASNRGDR